MNLRNATLAGVSGLVRNGPHHLHMKGFQKIVSLGGGPRSMTEGPICIHKPMPESPVGGPTRTQSGMCTMPDSLNTQHFPRPLAQQQELVVSCRHLGHGLVHRDLHLFRALGFDGSCDRPAMAEWVFDGSRSEEHTSELQ